MGHGYGDGWGPCTEYPVSTTTCVTVLRLPLRTREASGDRHCRRRSTCETVVRCSVPCTLTAAVTGGKGFTDKVQGGCRARRDRAAHVSGWSHRRSLNVWGGQLQCPVFADALRCQNLEIGFPCPRTWSFPGAVCAHPDARTGIR